MEPLNENETTSPLQRILIGAGTLIVVVLTVVAAIFLAMQDVPEEEPTPVVGVSPTAILSTNTPTPVPPTSTPTSAPPTATGTPSPTPPPAETTQAPTPTNTNTPEPSAPTATNTPLVVVITATPAPASPTPEPAAQGTCPNTPPDWVPYTVQTGETLNSLAERTNSSVFDLQQANCLQSFTIRPGQEIFLPFTPPPPTETPTPMPAGTRGATPTRTPTALAPIINDVVPDRVDEDIDDVIITIIGRNFRSREADFKVELRGPQTIELQLGEARSDTSFDAIIPAGLPVGIYDVIVTNPNNRAGVRESAFIIGEAPPTPTVSPGPRIDDVDPEEGFNDEDVIIEVRGRDFRPTETGFQVQLRIGAEIETDLELVGSASSTSFNALIPAGLPPNMYDLWVINPDGKEDVEPKAYEVLE